MSFCLRGIRILYPKTFIIHQSSFIIILYLCALMKLNRLTLLLIAGSFAFLLSGCKNEFEKLRAGSDSNLQLTKALEYYEKKDYLKAQTLFELIMPTIRGRGDAEKVYFYYAYTHYYLDKFILASYYFKNFSSTFPNSSYREEADFMAAYSNFEMSPTYRLDQSYTEKAIEGFQLFVNTYPDSKRVDQCNKLIDEMRHKLEVKAYNEAQLYFDLQEYQSSVQVFENLLRDFPESNNSENISFMIIRSAFLLAENSIFEKKEDRYKLVIEKANEFKDKYQKSKLRKEVETYLKSSNKALKDLANVRHQNQSTRTGS